jgi:hypothetical protein
MLNRCFPGYAFLLLVMAASLAWSQETRGTIVGRVIDQTGAAIPGAQVTVTNKAMGTTASLTTNEVGLYQATFLLPGLYQVSVTVPNFKKLVRDDIEVRVNDRISLDLKLEVGAAAESVTVTGETPLLATATASAGTLVDTRRVAELPISYGDPFELMGLTAGASFTRDPRLDRPFEPTHIVGYTMDGTRANRSDVTLDGVPATATANAGEITASYVPPVDAIQEFRVQTATFDASFGQTEGGVTNISIKSGGNAPHGTAYWSTMLPEMSANDFFANATRQARSDFKYNRWGGTLGGPVYLPKVYDGRNKTFFFWAYEGIKDSRPRNNGTPTVPTAAMKQGDFSQLLAVNPANPLQYQIYNPFTRRAVAGGRYEADPFPDNIVPKSLFNPVAVDILKYFADPLQEGKPDGTNNFLQPNLQETADYYTLTGRLDQNISDRHRIYVRGSYYNRDSFYNDYFHNLSTGNFFQFLSRAGVIDDVYNLTPTTVLNVRYGYNRFVRNTMGNPDAMGMDLTTLGFTKEFNDQVPPQARQFPRIDLTGYQGTGIASEWRPIDTHSINASVSKAMGSHFWKAGMEFRAYRENSVPYGNDQVGRFIFDSTYTKGPLDNATAAPGSLGQSVAALLLGLPSGSSYAARSASYAEQSTSWGFFIHDDWKVSTKLTLNIGLRWEFEGPLTERFNRSIRGFDYSYVQPFQAAVQAAYDPSLSPLLPSQITTKGGMNFAGVNGEPRGLYETPKRNLMPRFGFAYQLDDRTVLRGGYGIFYGFLGQRRGDVIQSGFSRNTSFVATRDNVNFIGSLSNPFPDGVLDPVGAAQGPQTFVGNSITFFDENPLMPQMQRWSLGVQREVRGFVFDLSYIGNRGTHIEIARNINSTPQQYLSTSPFRDQAVIDALSRNINKNPFAGNLPAGASSSFTGSTIAVERLLRPYPQFDSVTSSRFDGYTWYHSAQLAIEKRFSKGYTISGNYTFSKYMQATELLDPADPMPVEVISDLDRPHRISISGIYEMPFGRGRRFLSASNPVLAHIVGGWQVSGIYAFQSGAPLGTGATSSWGNIIYLGDINAIKLSGSEQNTSHWFNTAGFVTDSKQQLDRNVRTFPLRFGFLRSDKISNFDFSVVKKTTVAEGKDISFRMDFLNAVNHPLLPNPDINPTSATFGQIVGASNQANYPRRIEFGFKFLF